MARLLYVNGSTQEVNPANGKSFTLEEMQAAVGGYVEVVRLRDGSLLLVNEEGKLNNLPYNEQATQLFNPLMLGGDFIVGNALLTNDKEIGD